ncbi:MAG: hypothetical protein ABSD71_04125 [Bacteroidales bacterium]
MFTFTEKPVLQILQILPSLLPGIEKVVAVYYSSDITEIVACYIRNEHGEYFQETFKIEDPSVFHDLRTVKTSYSWLKKEDIPFEIKHEVKVQMEIFNELNNNILLIRIHNQDDELNDLFFIYFNKDLSNFGNINPGKILTTENKTIIGHLLRNSIITFIKNNDRDKNLFTSLTENTRSLVKERNFYRNELKITQDKFKDELLRLSNNYLAELTENNGISYRFNNDAMGKIREYHGNLDDLKLSITQAVHFAETMNLDGNSSEIIISDFHLFMDVKKEPKQDALIVENLQDIPVKYNKTFLLLEKLENAANQLKSKNLLLTGANIGHEFPTPITPPAITDALKKHRNKILFLFEKYPDRWKIIRSEFRPVQNILNIKTMPKQISA